MVEEWERKRGLAFHVIVGTAAALCYMGAMNIYIPSEHVLSQEYPDLSRGSNFTGSLKFPQ